MSVGERSKILMLGEQNHNGWRSAHGHVWLYFLGVRFSIGADTTWTILESSAVSFVSGTVSIGDEVFINMSKSSVFTVQGADGQPSLLVGRKASISFGFSSRLLVDNGYLCIGNNSISLTQEKTVSFM